MLQNLYPKRINLSNAEKILSEPILLQGINPQALPFDSLTINLNNPHSSVLLQGTLEFGILDTVPGDTLGPLELQIVRDVSGKQTLIYEIDFFQNGIHYSENLIYLDTFSFSWLDVSPLCTTPCCCCPPPYMIKYTFQIWTKGLINETQEAGLLGDDSYSLNAIEI